MGQSENLEFRNHQLGQDDAGLGSGHGLGAAETAVTEAGQELEREAGGDRVLVLDRDPIPVLDAGPGSRQHSRGNLGPLRDGHTGLRRILVQEQQSGNGAML